MMKKTILFLIVPLQILFSQEKSRFIYNKETVFISNNKTLEIESFIEQKKEIAYSKNISEYTIAIPFDNFNDISNIKGSTFNTKKNKSTNLYQSYISTHDEKSEEIFHSDNKFKYFVFPEVDDKSVVEFSYKNKQKEPRLLSSFRFQNGLKSDYSKFQIKTSSSIKIGFKLFGNFQDKIVYTKTTEGDLDVYTWEAKDIPAFENEESSPNVNYFLPHIVYYIKSYQKDQVQKEILSDIKDLYQWYFSLVKNINTTDQTELKIKTLELIKNDKTKIEKAKSIYNWVQQNVHYVAFEDAMGGFIPRDAGEVFKKKYGDCKDMANLLNEMLKYSEIQSNLAWIGTRDKPYKYEDIPTPNVDNHMITAIEIEGKRFFLDATDKFCPFSYPTAMIQGKQALIGKSEKDFTIENVPILDQNKNKLEIEMDLNLNEKNIFGSVYTKISGYKKSNLLNYLTRNIQKKDEILKGAVTAFNEKIDLEIVDSQNNEYENQPIIIKYNLKLDDCIKNIGEKILVKPILLYPFKDNNIDIEKRKLPIENSYAFIDEFIYKYEIPSGYKFDFIPENYKFENDLLECEIQYKPQGNKLVVNQKIISKKLLIENKDFESWNLTMKNLNKQYNQSIILKK